MSFRSIVALPSWRWGFSLAAAVLLAGCAASSLNWDDRVGVYSWDDAVAELGEPDRVTEVEGGVRTAEWVTQRGVNSTFAAEPSPLLRGETVRADEMPGRGAPPKVLRLSFTPDGKLLDWARNY